MYLLSAGTLRSHLKKVYKQKALAHYFHQTQLEFQAAATQELKELTRISSFRAWIAISLLKNPYNQEGLTEVDTQKISSTQTELDEKLRDIYSNLDPWQTTMVARHEDRPKAKFFIDNLFEDLDITTLEVKDLIETNPLISKAIIRLGDVYRKKNSEMYDKLEVISGDNIANSKATFPGEVVSDLLQENQNYFPK